jgi:peptidoglycan/xylan/chitin deacetylase (PgdA/CDA1 family)
MIKKKTKSYLTIFVILVFVSILMYFSLKTVSSKKYYVSITFDDAYEDQFLNAFPLLKKKEVAATVYVIANLTGKYFEGHKLMTTDQLKELEGNGWEIGSHTLTHANLTTLSDEAMTDELELSKKNLLENGFLAKSLAIPYGNYNKKIGEKSMLYYDSVRTSNVGINPINKIDRYELKSFFVMNTTSVDEMEGWVDLLKDTDGGWLIIMVHHVVDDKSSLLYSMTPKDLEEMINYIQGKNIPIKTVSEVLDEIN